LREEVAFLSDTKKDVAGPRGERPTTPHLLAHGKGCSNCRDTGYRGRIGVFELLMIDDPVRSKIQDRSNASEIRDVALTRGMRLLRDDGVVKILEGHTTVEEVGRVTVRAAM
jgi:type II secretory ATPase GspE/PulE/Tfp pilus assembly ATPase PilB-like protein